MDENLGLTGMARNKTMRERLVQAPVTLRERLAQSERAQRLLYEMRNRRMFSDFFQHDRMLADRARIESYWEAFEKHIGEGDVVIDIGAGTGVLSFFAASQGAQVHAVEHGPVIEAAKAVARDNGIDNVEFHRANSRALELPVKADAIIHEQIGDALFDERAVENIADARDRLLKPGGKIYPALLDLYIEPVQLRDDLRAPFAWEQRLHGVDFGAIEEFAELSHSYLYKSLRPFPFGQFLSRPEPVVSIDLQTANAADLPTEISYLRPVTASGILDGFCVYFEARFDEEIGFSSSPELPTTNWANPFLRVRSHPVEQGEEIALELTADDLATPRTWDWNLDA
jgi:type I protein arginine methyltransferase